MNNKHGFCQLIIYDNDMQMICKCSHKLLSSQTSNHSKNRTAIKTSTVEINGAAGQLSQLVLKLTINNDRFSGTAATA